MNGASQQTIIYFNVAGNIKNILPQILYEGFLI